MSMTIKIAAATALGLATLAPTAATQAAVTQPGLASNAASSLTAPMLVATPVPEPPKKQRSVYRQKFNPGGKVRLNPQPEPPSKRRSIHRQKFNPGGKVGFNPQPEPPKIKKFKR